MTGEDGAQVRATRRCVGMRLLWTTHQRTSSFFMSHRNSSLPRSRFTRLWASHIHTQSSEREDVLPRGTPMAWISDCVGGRAAAGGAAAPWRARVQRDSEVLGAVAAGVERAERTDEGGRRLALHVCRLLREVCRHRVHLRHTERGASAVADRRGWASAGEDERGAPASTCGVPAPHDPPGTEAPRASARLLRRHPEGLGASHGTRPSSRSTQGSRMEPRPPSHNTHTHRRCITVMIEPQ